jgi:hypothetical protein
VDQNGPPEAYPARHAYAWLQSTGGVEWQGFLDEKGCTPNVEPVVFDYMDYTVSITTILGTDSGAPSTPTVWIYGNGNKSENSVIQFTTNKIRNISLYPIWIDLTTYEPLINRDPTAPIWSWEIGNPGVFTTPPTFATRTAAVASTMYGYFQFAGTDFSVQSNSYCPKHDTDPANFPGNRGCYYPALKTVYLGPNAPETNPSVPNDHTTNYKTVIAHEFGHVIQGLSNAYPSATYNAAGFDPSAQGGTCGCTHVADPGDRMHCLQGRSEIGVAQVEGFAHYIASTVWSHRVDQPCSYAYYKNFNRGDLEEALPPPILVSCSDTVKYHENNCFKQGGGVEWDWMNFQRSLGSTDAASYINTTDLLDIYRRACSLGSTSSSGNYICSGGESLPFDKLNTASIAKFGLNTPKALAFHNNAFKYGVEK